MSNKCLTSTYGNDSEAQGIVIGFVLTATLSGFAMNSVCGGLAVLCGLISLTAAINYLEK